MSARGGLRVLFVTGNRHKFEEAKAVAESLGVSLVQARLRKLEIQSDDLREIAVFSSRSVRSHLSGETYIVEDAGLFIHSLGGFPGPYSSYVYRTIGCEGVLKLLAGVEDRRATFRSVVVLHDPRLGEHVFVGETRGAISREARGSGGFGFDPIFVPEGESRTYAEMTLSEKNALSHRAKAVRGALSFLVSEAR